MALSNYYLYSLTLGVELDLFKVGILARLISTQNIKIFNSCFKIGGVPIHIVIALALHRGGVAPGTRIRSVLWLRCATALGPLS